MNVKRIAVFASGSGTNAQKIFEYFAESKTVVVDSLWTNRPGAYALTRAENYGIQTFIFDRNQFYNTNEVVDILRERKVDLVVLAGFLWLVPLNLIRNFKIVNIHPALLPKYGGKGMYGMHVHQAVIESGDKESGISVHYVNENFDEGELIFQARCPVYPADSANDLAQRIHELEHRHFPQVIEKIINQMT